MPFLGSQPAEQYKSLAKQTITGDGSTSYTLNRSVTNAYDMEVFINNTRQEPDTSYTASGNTITFTAAVTSSDSCYLIYQGQSVGSISPPANSVGGTQIQNTSVTNAHLAGAITDAKLHSSLDLSSKTLTMPNGHVIQVQTTSFDTATSVASGTPTTFMTVNITPKFSNSLIIVQITSHFWHTNYYTGRVGVFRGSTDISKGTDTTNVGGNIAAGNEGGIGIRNGDLGSAGTAGDITTSRNWAPECTTAMYTDSPSTTSQVTYTMKCWVDDAGSGTSHPLYINRSNMTSDSPMPKSTMTVTEIAQ